MTNLPRLLICLLSFYWIAIDSAPAAEPPLLGHWPLSRDARDHSGREHHGRNRGVRFNRLVPDGRQTRAAQFDGLDDFIEIPAAEALGLGKRDFSIAARVYTERKLDDVPGDLLSKFDPRTRRGFNFGILSNAGMTTSQTNHRNLHFGIDNAVQEGGWQDCGRPGRAVFICSLAVHDGNLYAGTFEISKGETGHLFRYVDGQKWEDCGSPDESNSVMSLAVFDGRLYAGTGRYNSRGSALPQQGNSTPGGRVFRYEGGQQWTPCGRPVQLAVTALTVFNDRLYASAMYDTAVFAYAGDESWKRIGTKQRVFSMTPYNGHLYAATSGRDEIWRWKEGEEWTPVGAAPRVTQYYSFAAYQGQLHTGTWPEAVVYRFDGKGKWQGTGRPAQEKETMALGVYNGKLYTGTLPAGEVFRLDDGGWTSIGTVDATSDVRYRRAWTMAVYRGKLFCGTLPSGRVMSLEAGRVVTDDRALQPGWRHVAAVRRGEELLLYVDGKLRSRSGKFDPDRFDLTNDQPLRIGFGETDYFRGYLKDVRLYDGALDDSQVAALAEDGS